MSHEEVKEAEDLQAQNSVAADKSDDELLGQIIVAIRTVYDPEISTNIYDLGLIYAIDLASEREVAIKMTLTAPGCPVAGILPGQVARAVETIERVDNCHVELVWDPPWTKDHMSDEAKLELGML